MPFADYEAKLAATENAHLKNQVMVAIAKAATFVIGGGSPNNRNHETHAERADQNPASYIQYFIWDVVDDTAVANNYPNQTDAQVQAVVDAKWPRAWK